MLDDVEQVAALALEGDVLEPDAVRFAELRRSAGDLESAVRRSEMGFLFGGASSSLAPVFRRVDSVPASGWLTFTIHYNRGGAMPLPSGTNLGPYQIEGLLGAGGMGEVYRAHDGRVGRDVAVKIVPPAVAADATALSRFEREARAVATLSHPNIVALYEFGASDGMTYAVMELLEGEPLRSRLASGPLPLRKAVDIAAQIARGLAAAHDKHIVHRDLKPENVFIATDGTVKILDFGLARQTTEPLPGSETATMAPVTEAGIVLGTVGYMAPEQVRGERSDHRADIFALGCIIHEMLTGHRAFERGTAAETMTAILREEPSPPVSTVSGVPLAVERILNRCLEKRPEERFQSARDLTFAVESSLDARSGSDVGAVRPARPGFRGDG
jgi:eukaryotic-like serine/threonine-protein kinase